MESKDLSEIEKVLNQLGKEMNLADTPEKDIESIELPDYYESRIYQPEPCAKCEKIDRKASTPVGVKLVTPYSYLLLEGCDSDVICPVKTFQVMYYGVYIKFPDEILAGPESTMLIKATWEMLSGERKLEDIDEMVRAYKRLILYPEGKEGEVKKPAKEIREFAKVIIKLLMDTKFPVVVKYPYPKKHFVWIDLFSQKEELTEEDIVKVPCPFDPWDMMYIKVEYENKRIVYCHNIELIPEKHPKDLSGSGFVAYRKDVKSMEEIIDDIGSYMPYVKILGEYFELLYHRVRKGDSELIIKNFSGFKKVLEKLGLMLRKT